MPLFSYSWQQAFVSPFVPSDDDIVASFLQVHRTLPSPPTCDDAGDDVFTRAVHLPPPAQAQAQQRCACAAPAAIHMDIIAERMSKLLPMPQGPSWVEVRAYITNVTLGLQCMMLEPPRPTIELHHPFDHSIDHSIDQAFEWLIDQ